MTDHIGVQPEKEDGLVSIGVPVKVGLLSGEQMVAVAELAAELGRRRARDEAAELRPHVRRAADVERVGERLAELDLPLTGNPLRAEAIACTGEPHCNFAVTETKSRLDVLVEHLEARFGDALAGLKLNLDGCPHACAPPLGRRPRLPGLDRAQRGRRAPPGLRPAPARRPRPRRRDRATGLPPRPGRGARRHGHRPPGRLAAATGKRRELPCVLRPHERRASSASWPGKSLRRTGREEEVAA